MVVPALLSWHPEHGACRDALGQVDRLPMHVVAETFSVLTRLPAPHRVAPADAAMVLSGLALPLLELPGRVLRSTVLALGRSGVGGGAVYDALVAATAHHHQRNLLTRDQRARSTYDLIGVRYALV
nr:PIN domain-containing protein [Nocardioides daejeonensis]